MPITCGKFDSTDFNWARISAQVARLEGLDKFPFGIEAKRELCFALLTADSVDEAKSIIDQVMVRTGDNRCPTPPDLRRLITAEHDRGHSTADDLTENYRRENRPSHCAICGGFGITESTNSTDLHSIASYCACTAGRARSSQPDSYSPDLMNAARAKLIARKMDLPKPGPERKPPSWSPGAAARKDTGTDDGYQGDY